MSDPIVSFDEAAMRGELRELVRRTVEDTLNALLEEEADDLIGADRYERTAGREAYRAGHYERGLTTTSGQVTLRMPKLKGMRFATAIIERYKRRETSVEEAMIEMYLAGVSTRRIEDVSEILWNAACSALCRRAATFWATDSARFRQSSTRGRALALRASTPSRAATRSARLALRSASTGTPSQARTALGHLIRSTPARSFLISVQAGYPDKGCPAFWR